MPTEHGRFPFPHQSVQRQELIDVHQAAIDAATKIEELHRRRFFRRRIHVPGDEIPSDPEDRRSPKVTVDYYRFRGKKGEVIVNPGTAAGQGYRFASMTEGDEQGQTHVETIMMDGATTQATLSPKGLVLSSTALHIDRTNIHETSRVTGPVLRELDKAYDRIQRGKRFLLFRR